MIALHHDLMAVEVDFPSDMLIYVAGPMSGLVDFNRERFEIARCVLESKFPDAGVFIPHDIFGGRQDLTRPLYMKVDTAVVAACDMLALLPGWEQSAGASAEYVLATGAGKPIYFIHENSLVQG